MGVLTATQLGPQCKCRTPQGRPGTQNVLRATLLPRPTSGLQVTFVRTLHPSLRNCKTGQRYRPTPSPNKIPDLTLTQEDDIEKLEVLRDPPSNTEH